MGSTHFLILSPFHLFLNPNKTLPNPNFSSIFCCQSSSRPNWGSNSDAFRRRRFDFEDERREKRRNRWFFDDDDDEEEDDDDVEFGFWEEPATATDWFLKIFSAFGWMVPAMMISTLLGTGSNSLIMALVVPLGQTALSLVMDRLSGGPSSSPNFRTRSRPRSKSRSRSRSRAGRSPFARTGNSSAKRGGRSNSKYNGWDELDQELVSNDSIAGVQRQTVDGIQSGYVETGKLSKKISRDKPLFIRLLIAMFPFMGSWTRFLF